MAKAGCFGGFRAPSPKRLWRVGDRSPNGSHGCEAVGLHWARLSVKPFMVGTMHGLAGSSAIVLAVAAAAGSIWSGLGYVCAFGIGSILGMVLLGLAMSVPLVVTAPHGRHAQLVIQGLASLCSVALGLSMIYRLGLQGAL